MTPPHTSSFITEFRHDNSYNATLSPSTIVQQPQKPDGCQNDDGLKELLLDGFQSLLFKQRSKAFVAKEIIIEVVIRFKQLSH